MDEPSSGLDAASEELVFEAIERLMEGKPHCDCASLLDHSAGTQDLALLKMDGSWKAANTSNSLRREVSTQGFPICSSSMKIPVGVQLCPSRQQDEHGTLFTAFNATVARARPGRRVLAGSP